MCLGIVLDENLTFDMQADHAVRKTLGAVTRLNCLLGDHGGVRADTAITLFKTYIRPHLEYGFGAWCTVNHTAIAKLERAHRISLLKVTGCLSCTPTSALEVLTHTLPLKLRLNEIICTEYLRVLQKPSDHPLRVMIGDPEVRSTDLTPANVMKTTTRLTAKKLQPSRIEPHPSYDSSYMKGRVIDKELIAWSQLGNSSNRSEAQKLEANKLTTEFLSKLDHNKVVVFTDGSALGNPGPCGAGAAIFLYGMDTDPIKLHKAISTNSTSYHGELAAIKLALEYLVSTNSMKTSTNGVNILTDCQSALSAVCSSTSVTNHNKLVTDILDLVDFIKAKDIHVSLTWVAGHAGLHGNEIADACAKLGAQEAAEMDPTCDDSLITIKEGKQMIKEGSINCWQRQWNLIQVSRQLHIIQPNVVASAYKSRTDRETEKKMFRLRADVTKLRSQLWRMKIPGVVSPLCECEDDTETVSHVLCDCSKYTSLRDNMIDTIELGFVQTCTPIHLRAITGDILLGHNPELPKEMAHIIETAVEDFIRACPARI